MAIPTYNEFYRAVLDCLNDGEVHRSREINNYCADVFHLTPEERSALLPSNRQTVLSNRVGWARTYLKKAHLIESPARGKFKITEAGVKAISDPSLVIDNDYLGTFQSFREFFTSSKEEKEEVGSPEVQTETVIESTPIETMDEAYKKLTSQLADQLLANILAQDPYFFEQLVMDLLEKMGYGGELSEPSEVTSKSGDEGIDGIIRQDALGFDKIYVQAKKWAPERSVGSPDIQQFAGALMGKGANKGLYITTSHFSDKAKDFVDKHMTAKIVLVDGEMLTSLMIKYNLGVSLVHSYEIKRVDTDYFNNDNE